MKRYIQFKGGNRRANCAFVRYEIIDDEEYPDELHFLAYMDQIADSYACEQAEIYEPKDGNIKEYFEQTWSTWKEISAEEFKNEIFY